MNVHLFCCAVLPVVASHSSFLLGFHLFRLFVSWGVELEVGKFLSANVNSQGRVWMHGYVGDIDVMVTTSGVA